MTPRRHHRFGSWISCCKWDPVTWRWRAVWPGCSRVLAEPRTCSGASPHSRNALKCVPSMWRAFSEVTGGRILWVTVACVEVEGEVGTLQWLPTRLHLISDPGRSAAHWWHISQRSLCVWVACWKTEEERMPVCVMNYFLAESGEPSDLSFFNGGSLICLWLRETSPPD